VGASHQFVGAAACINDSTGIAIIAIQALIGAGRAGSI